MGTRLAGISLLEIVIALAILALLVGLATPIYLNRASNGRARAATLTLVADLRAAQQDAVARRTVITVMLSRADAACPNGAASYTLVANEEVVRRTCLAVDLAWAMRPDEPLVYQPSGATGAAATIALRSTRTGHTYTVTVQAGTGEVTDDAR